MLHHVYNRAGSVFDLAISRALFGRSKAARGRSRSESLGHLERMAALERMAGTWDAAAERPDFFADPAPIAPRLSSLRTRDDVQVLDATWPSGFASADSAVAERYGERTENRSAAARLFLHPEPRPTVILIHGYRGGHFALEEPSWPLRFMLARGLDVALFVLPFHGVRATPGRSPFFPSSDPRITNEAFRQSVLDLRTLAAFLRGRGAPAVGVMGMSLGGYTTALAATVDDALAFAVPIIPLASLADIAHQGGRFVGTPDEQQLQRAALERAHRTVSPLHRASRLAPDRVLVVAASGDRITPVHHAQRLAAHFGAPIAEFAGGHLLQFGRADGFRAAFRMLGKLGYLR